MNSKLIKKEFSSNRTPNKKIKKLIETICWPIEGLFEDIYFGIKNFPRKFKRAFSWFLFMYNNEEWDNHYIYAVLHKKLNELKNHWANSKNIWIINRKKYHRQIIVAEGLCKRLMDDNYDFCKEMKEHDKKWGRLQFLVEKEEDKEGFSRCDLYRKKTNTKEEKKQERKEYENIRKKFVQFRFERDKKYFFNLLRKKIDHWWD